VLFFGHVEIPYLHLQPNGFGGDVRGRDFDGPVVDARRGGLARANANPQGLNFAGGHIHGRHEIENGHGPPFDFGVDGGLYLLGVTHDRNGYIFRRDNRSIRPLQRRCRPPHNLERVVNRHEHDLERLELVSGHGNRCRVREFSLEHPGQAQHVGHAVGDSERVVGCQAALLVGSCSAGGSEVVVSTAEGFFQGL